jgi:hypothetical protein
VYAQVQRQRFVAGGRASRGMLHAFTQAHARAGRGKREGYGTSWVALASLAAVLGHESCLSISLPHLDHGWDQVCFIAGAPVTQTAVGPLDADTPCPLAARPHDSALLRA